MTSLLLALVGVGCLLMALWLVHAQIDQLEATLTAQSHDNATMRIVAEHAEERIEAQTRRIEAQARLLQAAKHYLEGAHVDAP